MYPVGGLVTSNEKRNGGGEGGITSYDQNRVNRPNVPRSVTTAPRAIDLLETTADIQRARTHWCQSTIFVLVQFVRLVLDAKDDASKSSASTEK